MVNALGLIEVTDPSIIPPIPPTPQPTDGVWRIGYKVVRGAPERGSWWSATDLGSMMFYSQSAITVRSQYCGPLAVFRSLEDAWEFCSQYFTQPTYSYQAGFVHRCRYLRHSGHQPLSTEVSKLILGLWCHDRVTSLGHLPEGTLLAEAVQLLELIEWADNGPSE